MDPAADTLRVLNRHAPVAARRGEVVRRRTGAGQRLARSRPSPRLEQLRAGEPLRRSASRRRSHPGSRTAAAAAERKQLRREYELKVQSGEWPRARNQGAALPLPARRHVAPGLHRARVARRRNGSGQDHPGHRRVRAAAPAGPGAARAGRHARLAQDRVGGADSAGSPTCPISSCSGPASSRGCGPTTPRDRTPRRRPRSSRIVNYEQMVGDALDVNARLRPDIVVLDEAQRIKNWSTKTAQAVKRLRSRYAFVLTGTPIENRIDELHSLMDFLEPGRARTAVPVQPRLLRTGRARPARSATATSTSCTRASGPTCCGAARPRSKPSCPSAPTATTSCALSPVQQKTYADHEAQVAALGARRHAPSRSPSRSRTSSSASWP